MEMMDSSSKRLNSRLVFESPYILASAQMLRKWQLRCCDSFHHVPKDIKQQITYQSKFFSASLLTEFDILRAEQAVFNLVLNFRNIKNDQDLREGNPQMKKTQQRYEQSIMDQKVTEIIIRQTFSENQRGRIINQSHLIHYQQYFFHGLKQFISANFQSFQPQEVLFRYQLGQNQKIRICFIFLSFMECLKDINELLFIYFSYSTQNKKQFYQKFNEYQNREQHILKKIRQLNCKVHQADKLHIQMWQELYNRRTQIKQKRNKKDVDKLSLSLKKLQDLNKMTNQIDNPYDFTFTFERHYFYLLTFLLQEDNKDQQILEKNLEYAFGLWQRIDKQKVQQLQFKLFTSDSFRKNIPAGFISNQIEKYQIIQNVILLEKNKQRKILGESLHKVNFQRKIKLIGITNDNTIQRYFEQERNIIKQLLSKLQLLLEYEERLKGIKENHQKKIQKKDESPKKSKKKKKDKNTQKNIQNKQQDKNKPQFQEKLNSFSQIFDELIQEINNFSQQPNKEFKLTEEKFGNFKKEFINLKQQIQQLQLFYQITQLFKNHNLQQISGQEIGHLNQFGHGHRHGNGHENEQRHKYGHGHGQWQGHENEQRHKYGHDHGHGHGQWQGHWHRHRMRFNSYTQKIQQIMPFSGPFDPANHQNIDIVESIFLLSINLIIQVTKMKGRRNNMNTSFGSEQISHHIQAIQNLIRTLHHQLHKQKTINKSFENFQSGSAIYNLFANIRKDFIYDISKVYAKKAQIEPYELLTTKIAQYAVSVKKNRSFHLESMQRRCIDSQIFFNKYLYNDMAISQGQEYYQNLREDISKIQILIQRKEYLQAWNFIYLVDKKKEIFELIVRKKLKKFNYIMVFFKLFLEYESQLIQKQMNGRMISHQIIMHLIDRIVKPYVNQKDSHHIEWQKAIKMLDYSFKRNQMERKNEKQIKSIQVSNVSNMQKINQIYDRDQVQKEFYTLREREYILKFQNNHQRQKVYKTLQQCRKNIPSLYYSQLSTGIHKIYFKIKPIHQSFDTLPLLIKYFLQHYQNTVSSILTIQNLSHQFYPQFKYNTNFLIYLEQGCEKYHLKFDFSKQILQNIDNNKTVTFYPQVAFKELANQLKTSMIGEQLYSDYSQTTTFDYQNFQFLGLIQEIKLLALESQNFDIHQIIKKILLHPYFWSNAERSLNLVDFKQRLIGLTNREVGRIKINHRRKADELQKGNQIKFFVHYQSYQTRHKRYVTGNDYNKMTQHYFSIEGIMERQAVIQNICNIQQKDQQKRQFQYNAYKWYEQDKVELIKIVDDVIKYKKNQLGTAEFKSSTFQNQVRCLRHILIHSKEQNKQSNNIKQQMSIDMINKYYPQLFNFIHKWMYLLGTSYQQNKQKQQKILAQVLQSFRQNDKLFSSLQTDSVFKKYNISNLLSFFEYEQLVNPNCQICKQLQILLKKSPSLWHFILNTRQVKGCGEQWGVLFNLHNPLKSLSLHQQYKLCNCKIRMLKDFQHLFDRTNKEHMTKEQIAEIAMALKMQQNQIDIETKKWKTLIKTPYLLKKEMNNNDYICYNFLFQLQIKFPLLFDDLRRYRQIWDFRCKL